MKKRFVLFLLFVLLALTGTGGIAAADGGQSLPYHVSDVAGLLSREEWQQLESEAETISETYGCGVYLVILDDYLLYDKGSDNFWTFSQAFYTEYNMGFGEEHTGVLLLMSMEERDYSILAHGSAAHYAFTDYGKEVLEQQFLDDFRRNDWYSGFLDYIGGCNDLLKRAAEGKPLDVSQGDYRLSDGVNPLFIILPPILIALLVCEGLRRQMKPVSKSNSAEEYVIRDSFRLSSKRDVFLRRSVHRTVIAEPSHRSGGGGGTSINSGGFSGHSGKF
ncbi:MAG: TPM domain-containing protein [Oscillospiraceae bacterium]|nr:TPM domain-containing protein [Oscillospiraceae bacterium]